MFNKVFIKDTLERAIATAAETALALLSALGVDLVDFDWRGLLVATGMAFLLTVLKSIVASATNSKGGASFVD